MSSHAANAFALTVFVNLVLPRRFRAAKWLFIVWAVLVSYSRQYLAAHFASDVRWGWPRDPIYVDEAQARWFHEQIAAVCDLHHPTYYARFNGARSMVSSLFCAAGAARLSFWPPGRASASAAWAYGRPGRPDIKPFFSSRTLPGCAPATTPTYRPPSTLFTAAAGR